MNKKRSARLAFLTGTPIGCLGGLIGLGGAEFRLPILVGLPISLLLFYQWA